MTKDELKQYRALKKENVLLEEKIEKLRKKQEKVPTVSGTVMSSSEGFPYTPSRVTVQMAEPKESDKIQRLVALKEHRKAKVLDMIIKIEQFISRIPDSELRQIFELHFEDGMTLQEIACRIHKDRSGIGKKISDYLE